MRSGPLRVESGVRGIGLGAIAGLPQRQVETDSADQLRMAAGVRGIASSPISGLACGDTDIPPYQYSTRACNNITRPDSRSAFGLVRGGLDRSQLQLQCGRVGTWAPSDLRRCGVPGAWVIVIVIGGCPVILLQVG
jgi:hypothetical protein